MNVVLNERISWDPKGAKDDASVCGRRNLSTFIASGHRLS